MVIRCNYCNKQYASYSSRCNHIKKYHNDEYIKSPQISSFFTHNSSKMSNINLNKTNKLCCQYCNKELSRSDNLKRHEKICVFNKVTNQEMQEIKKQNDELKCELKEIKKLIKINTKSKNIKNVINGNVINGNVINNYIIELGGENTKLLTEYQKLKVLKSINYGEYPVITLVDELFKNEKNRNIKISNLQNNIALKYDGTIEKFKAISKKQVINDIISVRKHDIRAFFKEFCDTNKINDKTKASIEKYLNKLNNSSEKNAELKKFMNEHKEQIIFIIYNITLIEESEIEYEIE
jgi:hypothetical protein